MSFVRLSLVSVAVRYFERCVFFVQIIAQSLFQIFQVEDWAEWLLRVYLQFYNTDTYSRMIQWQE